VVRASQRGADPGSTQHRLVPQNERGHGPNNLQRGKSLHDRKAPAREGGLGVKRKKKRAKERWAK